MTVLKVKDHPGLIRDGRSKAIINEDRKAFEAYISEKNFRNQIQQQNNEIDELKNDLNEIKMLLRSLIKDK